MQRLALVVCGIALFAACGGGSEDTATTTGAAGAGQVATTGTPAAAVTTTSEPLPETTTTTGEPVEAAEVSVSFDELSAGEQEYLSGVCGFATGRLSLTDLRVGDMFVLVQDVVSGWTGVPELEAAWLELANAGADADAFMEAAVPICLGTGWTPES